MNWIVDCWRCCLLTTVSRRMGVSDWRNLIITESLLFIIGGSWLGKSSDQDVTENFHWSAFSSAAYDCVSVCLFLRVSVNWCVWQLRDRLVVCLPCEELAHLANPWARQSMTWLRGSEEPHLPPVKAAEERSGTFRNVSFWYVRDLAPARNAVFWLAAIKTMTVVEYERSLVGVVETLFILHCGGLH